MKNLKILFNTFVAVVLCGCYSSPTTPKITKIAPLNLNGKVFKVSFAEDGYCYELLVPKGRTIPLCKAKDHYQVGDTIAYTRDHKGNVKTRPISQAISTKTPIMRASRPKKSKISTPKNETISFD